MLCGSENDIFDLNNKIEDVVFWFKMVFILMGKIVLFSSIILGEILMGCVFFKSDKVMNVFCCIFKLIMRFIINCFLLFVFDLF